MKLLRYFSISTLFLLSIFLTQVQKVAAADIDKSCTAFSASPTDITADTKSVTVSMTTFSTIDLTQGYDFYVFLSGFEGDKSFPIIQSDIKNTGGNNYTFTYQLDTKDIIRPLSPYKMVIKINSAGNFIPMKKADGTECSATVQKSVTPDDILPEGCNLFGDPVNRFTCDYTGNGWIPKNNNCDASHEVDKNICSSDEIDKFGSGVSTACISCKKNGTNPTIGHGETCTKTADCKDGRSCRTSALSGLRCLDGDSSLRDPGKECVVDASECGQALTGPAKGRILVCLSKAPHAVPQISQCTDPGACTIETTPPAAPGSAKSECGTATGNPMAYCLNHVCIIPPPQKDPPKEPEFSLCKQAADAPKDADPKTCPPSNTTDYGRCCKCLNRPVDATGNGGKSIWTGFGCISTSPVGIVSDFIKIALGISGGVIILTILAGAFILATSSGDPKKVQEAQEMISQAIMGFLFFIFSIVILRFIVISVLKLPGFGV